MTDEELRRAEHRLLAGAATYACGGYIARLDALHRNDLYTRLAYDRLERKYDVVRELFAESDSNWNQTFYVLLFRTIHNNVYNAFTEGRARLFGYSINRKIGRAHV